MQDLWLAFTRNPNGALDELGWPRSSAGAGGNVLEFAPQEKPDGPIYSEVVEAGSLSGVGS